VLWTTSSTCDRPAKSEPRAGRAGRGHRNHEGRPACHRPRGTKKVEASPTKYLRSSVSDTQATDKWAAWLLHRRDGDDPEQHEKALEYLQPIRHRVLDNARISAGDTVLDVGAGDGLIAFGALDRVGSDGHVVLSDISAELVAHAKAAAAEIGADGRMSFVQARAEDLSSIPDASVDVVTTRSVLIYVDDKAKAFREFHRVLRSGGRTSIYEPINIYFPDSTDEFWGFDSSPIRDLVAKVWEYEGWVESAYADDPMMNFTEKDLLHCAEDAGFGEVHIELLVDVEPGTWVVDWDRLLNTSPNPNAHTAGEALRCALTDEEFARVEAHLRPLADSGQGKMRSAAAYLTAVKS
jgi:arsenite methyltransferase